MKLYHELVEVGKFPNILRRDGDGFLLVIFGVNVYVKDGKVIVDPVYSPLFRYQKSAGQITIDLNLWRDTARRFIFQLKPPYLGTYKLEGYKAEYSEE